MLAKLLLLTSRDESISRGFFPPVPSASSRLYFRVEPLQFDPCFLDRELPVDGPLLLVDAC